MSKTINPLQSFFHAQPALANILGVAFLLCALSTQIVAVRRSSLALPHLIHKTGVVESWRSSGRKLHDAHLKIVGDETIYTTEYFGGWHNLQHKAERDEEVEFYTLPEASSKSSGETPYFGLSRAGHPRLSFWIFFELLHAQYTDLIIPWGLSFFGLPLFNLNLVRNRALRSVSACVVVLSFLLFFLVILA